jgi:serine/threonine protein kinase
VAATVSPHRFLKSSNANFAPEATPRHKPALEMDTEPPMFTDEEIASGKVLMAFMENSLRRVVRIGDMVVKLGPDLDLVEAESMKFISEKTSIPVPKVLNTYEKNGMKYIVMEYVKGKNLNNVWESMAPSVRETVIAELREYIRQMRQISPPEGVKIGSVTGGPAVDRRRLDAIYGGPFESEKDFNDWQLAQLNPNTQLANRDIYSSMHRTDHKIVFSHCDLAFHNVLVYDDHVSAIIDWEDAGWFPEHWEFCKTFKFFASTKELYLVTKQLFEKPYLPEYFMDMWFNREVKHGGF